MAGPSCALVSPGKTLCSTAGSTASGLSCASLSGARVALSFSAIVLVYVKEAEGVVWTVNGAWLAALQIEGSKQITYASVSTPDSGKCGAVFKFGHVRVRDASERVDFLH